MADDKNKEKDPELKTGEKIFWFPAAGYQIANLVEESRYQSGHIQRNEVPLRASEHVMVLSDPKQIAHVENSDAFKNGIAIPCKSMAEARSLTAIHNAKKSVKTFKSETIEGEMFQVQGDSLVSLGVKTA